jgi:tripartite ATP-independent transporter DctM subunit
MTSSLSATPASAGVYADSVGLVRVLTLGLDVVLAVALIGEALLVLANVFARTFLHFSILWTLEVSEIALSAMAFIGGAAAFAHGRHLAVRVVADRLPLWLQAYQRALVHWTALLVSIVGLVGIQPALRRTFDERTTMLQIPLPVTFAPLILGFAALAVLALYQLWAASHRAVISIGLIGTGLGGAVMATDSLWRPMVVDLPLLPVFALAFVLLIIAGIPVAFVFIAVAVLYLFVSGDAPPLAPSPTLQQGLGDFVLLAIPFFVLAGLLMDRGGVSRRLVEFMRSLIGHVRGGLLLVMVGAMYLFSGISGSKGADIAAVGTTMSGMLRREGYDSGESVAVLAASAAMGETIPPSVAILILSSVTSLSVAALFAAGVVPATLIAVLLMTAIYIRARRLEMPRSDRPAVPVVVRSGLSALVAVVVPVILFGGIISGTTTPTEVSAVAILVGLVVSGVVYRELTLAAFWETLRATGHLVGMVLFIVAAASAFSWTLTIAQLPQAVTSLVAASPGGGTTFLIVSIVGLVIVGAVFEGLPAILIFGPLMLPIALHFGVNPVQYGIVLIIAMGIGAFSPPMGVGLYTACLVGGASMEKTIRPMIWYVIVLMIGLVFVAFVPAISLTLPKLLHLRT